MLRAALLARVTRVTSAAMPFSNRSLTLSAARADDDDHAPVDSLDDASAFLDDDDDDVEDWADETPPPPLYSSSHAAPGESRSQVNTETGEVGGPAGPEPTRFNDWSFKGRETLWNLRSVEVCAVGGAHLSPLRRKRRCDEREPETSR
ncbi:uncharacterized protein AMSG_09280 [Thecamonas trahens ATCC 50062]|uniref:Succinate dehydrogenase assembly factor 4, mitochondrial n=1 Tax=Thecamonas trahens ATCC 50062 TaxID=461836 RepID=A0A0L0DLL2_THETB|nr:hypothetical protein AMSG_09280 [Thecamonas trahens ATCC 50062]KNC53197.1 hypothetical protein AMSG_09280 [Thecamonas trahens ATCC 50062]|eukprot:XP_013754667.1 hypothetical protein AMSG_09280 [Thecamonas trahens ATCC 50062]